ncbi:MAG: DUF1499 domain-containing protein [Candidatus Hydrogenedentes bacterium]|nr:DUF1499 domain-containing protein [Candidatus Hydrogenedentota bacterium]
MAEPWKHEPAESDSGNRAIFFAWAVLLPLGLLIAGAALAHFEVIAPFRGFLIFALGGLVSLVHTLILILVRAVTKRPPRIVVGLAALPMLVAIGSAAPGAGAPRINDVSTDVENPPQFVAVAELPDNAGRDMTFPVDFGPKIRDNYPNITTFRVVDADPSTRKKVFDAALEYANAQRDWAVIRSNADHGIIEGYAVTRLFRFRDDFVMRIIERDGQAMFDMRSKSRDGKGDLGANAKRIGAALEYMRATFGSASSVVKGVYVKTRPV